jgi:DNA/RNA-binding domain of Phe-tRNA-synthetase-like protein
MADCRLEVRHELPGWRLFWAELELVDLPPAAIGRLRGEVAERARASHTLDRLPDHPTAAAVRRLFRQAGCDPTRHRPSSEALLRRVLKGEELPSIHPLVDLNNCLSLSLVVPACVMAAGSGTPPFTFRAGTAGESMLSLRGPYELAGKPLLADAAGPFGTPITDSERVRVRPETRRAWLVAYLPAGAVGAGCASAALAALLADAPVATLLASGTTGGVG